MSTSTRGGSLTAMAARARANVRRRVVRHTVVDRYQRARVNRLLPALRELEPDILAARVELAGVHAEYVSRVSTAKMAMSLESAAFLTAYCRRAGVSRVLDLGSGFSSLVFRRCGVPEVVSVDDHDGWLEATRDYLEHSGHPGGELMPWRDVDRLDPARFDLVFHDLGSMATRRAALPRVLRLVTDAGVVFLDDVHKPDYRRAAEAEVRRAGRRWVSLAAFTRDHLDRYAAIAVPPGPAS
ncbi:hypothetical protein [Micromonospora sp. NPDC003776]